MRILVIRYSSLGDVVISTAVLNAIARQFSPEFLGFLTDFRYAAVLKDNPFVDELILFDRGESRISEYFRLKKILKRYDLVFDLQNKAFSVLISRSVSAGKIFRFSKRFYGRNQEKNILDLYNEFLKDTGVVMEEKRYFLYYKRLSAVRNIGINIEGGHISKRLVRQQLYDVVKWLSTNGFNVVLLGTNFSRELARDIMCRFQNIKDTTTMDVSGLIEAIASLNVLITTDSGPLHIAAALGVPTVAIFSSTSYKKWLPERENISLIKSDYECSPCSEYGTDICRSVRNFGCIRTISPDIIIKEALRLYEQDQKKD